MLTSSSPTAYTGKQIPVLTSVSARQSYAKDWQHTHISNVYKLNTNYIRDINLISGILKLLEENINKTSNVSLDQDLLKGKCICELTNRTDDIERPIQNKGNSCQSEESAEYWEKTYDNYTLDTGLLCRLCEQLQTLNIKKSAKISSQYVT